MKELRLQGMDSDRAALRLFYLEGCAQPLVML